MMHMWYWFGTDLGTFLFPGYNVTTVWALVSTCLGLAALAILYESMKVLQMKLQQSTVISLKRPASVSSESFSLLSKMSPRLLLISPSVRCQSWYKWMLQVLSWSIHTTLGYLLMLSVMTYNAYVSIALVVGSCMGYWVFGPTLIAMNMRRFQETRKKVSCSKECTDSVASDQGRESVASNVADQTVTEATVEIHATESA